ncbi:hypothetical protein XENOCAPTIV_011124, partial [Xenoophorus captivus]
SSHLSTYMEQLVKHLSRCQHLGWMKVIELKSASIHWLSCGQKAEPDVWTKMFCILSDSQLLMLDDLEVHPLLLAERAETCTIWLLRYTLHVTSAAPGPTQKGTEDKSQQKKTVSETHRCIRLMDGQTMEKPDGQMLDNQALDRQMCDPDFDDGKRGLDSVSAD